MREGGRRKEERRGRRRGGEGGGEERECGGKRGQIKNRVLREKRGGGEGKTEKMGEEFRGDEGKERSEKVEKKEVGEGRRWRDQ